MLKGEVTEGVIEVDNLSELTHLYDGEYDSLEIRVGNNCYLVPKERVVRIIIE